jgi:hypothetical protein
MGKTRLAVMLVAVTTMIAIAAPAAQAQAATPPTETTYQAKIGWAPAPAAYYQRVAFDFWGVFECTMAVGMFIAGNTYLVLKIKRLGGLVKYAKSLWKAKSTEERAKLIGKVFAYAAGTGGLIKVCTP